MAQITGGKVSYGRTVKTGDYENKRVDVELTFSVDEGEDYADVFDLASRQAVRKAEEMVSGALTKTEPQPAPKVAAAAPAAAEPPKKRGRPPANKAKADAAAIVDEPEAATDEDWLDGSPGVIEGEPITDAELADAAKKLNAKLGKPDVIKAVIKKYVPAGIVSCLASIPMETRPAFLAELGAM